MENFNIFIRSIFVDNMIFAYFLGMCSFLAVSKNVKTALGLGAAVTFMLVISLPINYLLETYVLREGARNGSVRNMPKSTSASCRSSCLSP